MDDEQKPLTLGAVLAHKKAEAKLSRGRPVYWMSDVPDRCQISNRVITDRFVDGAAPGHRGWACMHPAFYRSRGGRFGVGSGQLYEKQTDGQWLKIEG